MMCTVRSSYSSSLSLSLTKKASCRLTWQAANPWRIYAQLISELSLPSKHSSRQATFTNAFFVRRCTRMMCTLASVPRFRAKIALCGVRCFGAIRVQEVGVQLACLERCVGQLEQSRAFKDWMRLFVPEIGRRLGRERVGTY